MNCPNCSNKYSEEIYVPRMLHNCGHTFCESCVTKIAKSDINKKDDKNSSHVIICPSCNKETKTKEIANLTKNLALIDIMFSKPYSHSQSNSLNITSPKCDTISLNNSAREFFPKKNKILCAEHYKDLEAFCNSCKKLLCVSCIIEKDHKNHDLVSFENAFLNECNSFNSNFEKVKKDEENFDTVQNDLKNRKENIQKKYTIQIETVETFFKEVYSVLNEREKFIKVKLSNESENEENILKGFDEKLQNLRTLAETIKIIKNNFETLSEVEILSNTVETGNIFKDINKNLEIVDKLQLIKEFQFSQLERESEISIIKEILSKRLITQSIDKEILTTSNDKEKITAESLAAQNSKRYSYKPKRVSNVALNTSVNKINPIPLYNPPEPVKFNYVKTDVDSRINSKKSESVLKLFPQLKSKTTKISNLSQQASVRQLVTGNVNSNLTKKLSAQYQSNKGEINEIKEYNRPKESTDDLSLEFDEKEFNNLNSDRRILEENDDPRNFDNIKHVECMEDSMANNSHFIHNMNGLNLNNEYGDNDAENQRDNERYSTQNTNMIQDSKIFYQLNDVTNQTRNEIDYNDFQVSSPGKVLKEFKSDAMNMIIGNNLDDLNLNRISSISHNTKSFIQTDISSIYNKTGNPFVVLLGGKGDYSTKKYSVDEATWVTANSTASSNPIINTNNPKDSLTNTGTNSIETPTHDFIKVERSDFVALMYKEKKILIIGGKTLNEKGVEVITDTIDLLNIKEKNVSRLSIKLKHCLINFGAVYINSKLYISGGFNGSQSTNNFEYFDKINRIWVDLPKMLFRRKEFSMVVGPDSCIYAIGGADEREVVTKSVEKFDLVKNVWTRIGDMNIKRKGCAGVCMPDGIYVIGGFDGCQYLKSVERYDFMTKKWSHIEDMNHPRCLFSCSVSSDLQYIYVAGGYDGKPLNTIERYDVFMNKWEVLERMVSPKYRHQSIFLKE